MRKVTKKLTLNKKTISDLNIGNKDMLRLIKGGIDFEYTETYDPAVCLTDVSCYPCTIPPETVDGATCVGTCPGDYCPPTITGDPHNFCYAGC